MAIATERIVILIPPKTGSAWLRTALNNANVEWWQDGEEHGLPVSPVKNRTACLVVRHPATWLRSYYCYRFTDPVRLYPELDEIIDLQQADGLKLPTTKTFERFVFDVTTLHTGFVGKVFGRYNESHEKGPGNQISIRSETLRDNMPSILNNVGEPFDQAAFVGTPRMNECSLAAMPRITPAIENRVAEAEGETISCYGYDTAVYGPYEGGQ